jgi:hypothetical protein
MRVNDGNCPTGYHSWLSWEADMNAYRIRFMNDLVNSTGHCFHCCQETIEILSAKSKDRAVEAAKHRFARRQAVPHWGVRAHLIEVEEISPVAQDRAGRIQPIH